MLLNKYNPEDIEDKWYKYWMEKGYFRSIPNEREPYTIVIPPPNVTGILHMGHMLNNTIQDLLIRRARLKGFNACWVPGTDHASIATEAKVVAKLKSEGINKEDLTRDEFIKYAWDWTDKHGGIILEQLKKIGASCDWGRTAFTMDTNLSENVSKVFIDLHKKGLIYRGYRMVNWDPEAKTTLSDEEVEFIEKEGSLYYINYKIKGSKEKITVATTRPETIFGDTAICINPDDKRFIHLKGKEAIVPIVNRPIPIIEDSHVDIEFGTGCLKITPAHDQNDKIIGERHNLKIIDILNEDATLNSEGMHYEGQNRFVVRKEIQKELEKIDSLIKIEKHKHKIGISERTKSIIEPKISIQWFLKMDKIVKPALEAVLENEEVKFYPKHYKNTYKNWLENIKDWNISRQLWWGHQIPAYFYGDGIEDYVVAETKEQALKKAIQTTGNSNLKISDLKQAPDVLDTWFSSWLWPISLFDGIRNPNNKEFNYYYPTNDLVTGPDIIFFWVARMIIAGYEFKNTKPFNNVYFTGIVRDLQGRKMSKYLGNSPDSISLIKKYGADGVRTGLLLSASAGNDLLFGEELCVQGRNFSNKIWNAFRLIKGWKISKNVKQSDASKVSINWYNEKFQKVLDTTENLFEQYRISEVLMTIYRFVYDDFCSLFLELVKPDSKKTIDILTYKFVINFLENNLRLLHPFIPFLTEEIWQNIKKRTSDQALIIERYPRKRAFDRKIISDFEFSFKIISQIRKIRKENNIPFKESVELFVLDNENKGAYFNSVIEKLGNVSKINKVTETVEKALSFRIKSNEYFIPFVESIDKKSERQKLDEELKYTEGFLKSVQKKLNNSLFIKNAPEKVISIERKKESDALAKIKMVKASLKSLDLSNP